MEVNKILVIGIILLFIGIAVAPSINTSVVKASNDNDLVEVTTQACGIKGYGNTTVKLTREQYQNLEQYLVEFRARLNQTSTREEAVPIFKEAVVKLNNYGLLPKGMNVEKTQKLVTGEYLNKKIITTFERLTKDKLFTNETNTFCLTVGDVHLSFLLNIMNILSIPYSALWAMIIYILFIFIDPYVAYGIAILAMISFLILLGIGFISPFSIIFAGLFNNSNLYTFGLKGKQIYSSGSILGFIGLKLWIGIKDKSDEFFLLGFSLATKNQYQ